jgi:hypothetical protein
LQLTLALVQDLRFAGIDPTGGDSLFYARMDLGLGMIDAGRVHALCVRNRHAGAGNRQCGSEDGNKFFCIHDCLPFQDKFSFAVAARNMTGRTALRIQEQD